MKIAFDSCILIHAFDDQEENQERAELHLRATILMQELEDSQDTILIPSPALAEFLIPYPIEKHDRLIAEMAKHFVFASLDVKGGRESARLWLEHATIKNARHARLRNEKITRQQFKFDVIIVACAKASGASRFYSTDAGCRELAETAGMVPLDLPLNHPDMFKDDEMRKAHANKLKRKK